MTFEIKTRCAECGSDIGWYHEVSISEFVINTYPCPNCHPSKPEKVTPKEGEWVEVRKDGYPAGIFDTRLSDGVSGNGHIGCYDHIHKHLSYPQ